MEGWRHVLSAALFRYPALLTLYSGGITALAAKKYATFAALLGTTRCRLLRDDLPMVLGVNTWDVMEKREKWLPGKETHYTPLSDNLFELLRDPLHEYLPDDRRYEEAFDEFEYILSLICCHFSNEEYGRYWLPFGRFTWNYKREGRNSPGNSPMNKVEAETEKVGPEWPLLKFGLFSGSLERFQEIKQRADQLIREKSGRLI